MTDFMQDQIVSGRWIQLDTTEGIVSIPADLVGENPSWDDCADYHNGDPMDPETPPETVEGFGARLSAPGYMDCTPWLVFGSEKEASDHLAEMYGDE